MDPTSSLDLISKEKVHHFFIFLPLLTLFLIKVNLFILIGYTIIWALAEVYVINLTAFKNLSANAVISPPNPKKKLKPRKLCKYLQQELWFIKNVCLMTVIMFVICGSFIATFVISIININQDYMVFVMLAHIFLGVFMLRLINTINYLSSLTKVKRSLKNGK